MDSERVEVTPLHAPMKSRLDHFNDDNDVLPAWEPDHSIELELRDWQSQGCHPATHLVQHAYLQHRLSYSDVELKAIQPMEEPMELELPPCSHKSFFRRSVSQRLASTMSR